MNGVGRFFTILFVSAVGMPVYAQDQELVCFNTQCFVPAEEQEDEIKQDTADSTPSINYTLRDDLQPIRSLEEDFTLEETNPGIVSIERPAGENDPSKYFEILDEDSPFKNKRIFNVPSTSLQDGTNAGLEATRPKVVLKHFNKPRKAPEMNFNERYEAD